MISSACDFWNFESRSILLQNPLRKSQPSMRISRALLFLHSTALRTLTTLSPSPLSHLLHSFSACRSTSTAPGDTRLCDCPWSASQLRGVKVNAIHVNYHKLVDIYALVIHWLISFVIDDPNADDRWEIV